MQLYPGFSIHSRILHSESGIPIVALKITAPNSCVPRDPDKKSRVAIM